MSTRRFSGPRLKEARIQRGLNQRTLGKLAGVSCPFISQLETGRSTPTLDRAFRLADALNVSIYALTTVRGGSRP
jgi:transcriptional regulator with XRE-family HTH domain